MNKQQRTDKIRSAAAQVAALAAARKAMRRYQYGQREPRTPNKTDISFGWGETTWSSDR